MKIRRTDKSVEIWISQDDRIYVVVVNVPDYTLDCVLRYVDDNIYEISSFDLIEPLAQMKVMQKIRELKLCQDQS